MRRACVFLVGFGWVVVSALAPAQAALLGEDDLADVVRKPAIGLYKGYAEFKMAHYAEARQIWMAAGTTAWHFDHDEASDRWVARRTGDELMATVARVVGDKLGARVSV